MKFIKNFSKRKSPSQSQGFLQNYQSSIVLDTPKTDSIIVKNGFNRFYWNL